MKAKVIAAVVPGVLQVKAGDATFEAVTPINRPPPAVDSEIHVAVERQGDRIVAAWHVDAPVETAGQTVEIPPVETTSVETAAAPASEPAVNLMQDESEPAPAAQAPEKKKKK